MEQFEFAFDSCLVNRSNEGLLAELLRQMKGPSRTFVLPFNLPELIILKVFVFHS